jgi:hypothetical protein
MMISRFRVFHLLHCPKTCFHLANRYSECCRSRLSQPYASVHAKVCRMHAWNVDNVPRLLILPHQLTDIVMISIQPKSQLPAPHTDINKVWHGLRQCNCCETWRRHIGLALRLRLQQPHTSKLDCSSTETTN